MIRRTIASVFWKMSRWTLDPAPAPNTSTVFLGAPHTSNWDFVYMLGIVWVRELKVRWVGKDALFAGWRGPIMRALGGIPIDRNNAQSAVDELVALLKDGEVFSLVITPDGTRGKHDYWKSGFYRIAQQLDVPVTLGYIDRTTMTTGLGPSITLTGDVSKDMDRIREFYADKAGFYPENKCIPRLRSEDVQQG